MPQTVNINGVAISYPVIGDTEWGVEATKFAELVGVVLQKIGQGNQSTTNNIVIGSISSPGNLTVASGDLSVSGNTTLTGNLTTNGTANLNGNTNIGNANTDTIAVTGILNVDSGTLYVNPTNNRVGINDSSPSEALDVVGNALVSGTLGVTGNSTFSSNLSVDGDTTLGNASGDSLTINGNAVSIPNGLNIDSNTLVVDATNNRVGIGLNNPSTPLEVVADGGAFALKLRGRSLDGISMIQFVNNTGGTEYSRLLGYNDGTLRFSNGSTAINRFQVGADGQLSAVVPGGSTLYNGYLCRAWVNFNGTLSGTITPRKNGNVTSVTKNSTGDYTINFLTAMPDADYAYTYGGRGTNGIGMIVSPTIAPTTTALRITTFNGSFSLVDFTDVCVGIFR